MAEKEEAGVVLKLDRLYSLINRIIEIVKDRNFGYSMDEAVVIFELFSNEGKTQNEIAEILSKDKSSIKRTIDKLEKKRLVRRVRDESDRRKYRIFLTVDGTGEKEYFFEQMKIGKQWFEEGLGKDKHREILDNLTLLEDFFRATMSRVKSKGFEVNGK